jgi:hypothetical protein
VHLSLKITRDYSARAAVRVCDTASAETSRQPQTPHKSPSIRRGIRLTHMHVVIWSSSNSRKLIERADSGIHSFWKRWIQSIRMGRRRRTCWIDIFVCGPFITSGANSNFEIHSEAESRQDKATIFTRTYKQNFTSSHFKLLSLGH